jgi:hypothetical protein
MILGEPSPAAALAMPEHGPVSIDEIFRHIARQRPDMLAIADAPNRQAFTDGAPRRLSYAQADGVVDAIAGRLRRMGLPTDAVIGIQMPNIVEHTLAMLAVMRAGMIAAPLPLLWRCADTIAALARLGCKALIACNRVGSFNHCQFALRVALEVFSIRYVCGFGADLPDGVVSFDDLLTSQPHGPPSPPDCVRRDHWAAHVAAISFDVGAGGVVPVARSHLELLAGGLEVLLEGGLARHGVILSTMAPCSFAGLSLTLLPWLLSGSTLLLHHPFNSNILGRQWRDDRFGTVILPGPVALRLAATGAFGRRGPDCIIAPWRSPEMLAASPDWCERQTRLVDVSIFGESGLVAGRRDADGRPLSIPLGTLAAPRRGGGAVAVAELLQTPLATLALRGPMVPHHAFPPGIERSGLPHFKIGDDGWVDSGYACSTQPDGQTVVVTAPPAEFAIIGGYRFPLLDLQDVVGRIEDRASLAAVPDPLLGQRLTAKSADPATIRAALTAIGLNPLVAAAFASS